MENIKLSTGEEVPPVEKLTDRQLRDLLSQPIYYETPEDIKNYLQQANKEYFRKKLQLSPMPFSLARDIISVVQC